MASDLISMPQKTKARQPTALASIPSITLLICFVIPFLGEANATGGVSLRSPESTLRATALDYLIAWCRETTFYCPGAEVDQVALASKAAEACLECLQVREHT